MPRIDQANRYPNLNVQTVPAFVRPGRAPTSADVNYDYGTLWENSVTGALYYMASVSAGSATWVLIGAVSGVPFSVAQGGTGLSTITDHGVMVGSGTDPVTPLAVGSNGQVLVGSTGADPVFATLASSNGSITYATGAGTLGLTVTQASTTQLGGATTATDSEARIGTSTTDVMTPANFVAAGPNNYLDVVFNERAVATSGAAAGGAPTGNAGDINLWSTKGHIWECFIIGTQTILQPEPVLNGLLVSLDLTNNEGMEMCLDNLISTYLGNVTVGTTAASFFELRFACGAGANAGQVVMGYRKAEAYQAAITTYTDYYALGVDTATSTTNSVILTRLNSGAATNASSGTATTTDTYFTYRINVSASGVVTATINGSAPATPVAFTFDTGDLIVPFFRILHGATPNANGVTISTMKMGLQ